MLSKISKRLFVVFSIFNTSKIHFMRCDMEKFGILSQKYFETKLKVESRWLTQNSHLHDLRLHFSQIWYASEKTEKFFWSKVQKLFAQHSTKKKWNSNLKFNITWHCKFSENCRFLHVKCSFNQKKHPKGDEKKCWNMRLFLLLHFVTSFCYDNPIKPDGRPTLITFM